MFGSVGLYCTVIIGNNFAGQIFNNTLDWGFAHHLLILSLWWSSAIAWCFAPLLSGRNKGTGQERLKDKCGQKQRGSLRKICSKGQEIWDWGDEHKKCTKVKGAEHFLKPLFNWMRSRCHIWMSKVKISLTELLTEILLKKVMQHSQECHIQYIPSSQWVNKEDNDTRSRCRSTPLPPPVPR